MAHTPCAVETASWILFMACPWICALSIKREDTIRPADSRALRLNEGCACRIILDARAEE